MAQNMESVEEYERAIGHKQGSGQQPLTQHGTNPGGPHVHIEAPTPGVRQSQQQPGSTKKSSVAEWFRRIKLMPRQRQRPTQTNIEQGPSSQLHQGIAGLQIGGKGLSQFEETGHEIPAQLGVGQQPGYDVEQAEDALAYFNPGDLPNEPRARSSVEEDDSDGIEVIDESDDEAQEMYVPNWTEVYQNFQEVGTDYAKHWGHHSNEDDYKKQIESYGYNFSWKDAIYIGSDDEFDHSVWKANRMENRATKLEVIRQINGQNVKTIKESVVCVRMEYAIKVVGLKYYKTKFKDLNVSVQALLKEAQLLLKLNHPNVIKVIENIPIEDRVTKFPYTYMAIVMEFMSGDLMGILSKKAYSSMEPNECLPWFTQIAQGLAYLHFNVRGPGIQSLVVTHMALMPRNILYKIVDRVNNQLIFKLTDFEEANIFDRSGMHREMQDQFNEDFVQSFGPKPYRHSLSAPELREPNWSMVHARPTDVYSLGMCLCFSLSGSTAEARKWAQDIRDSVDPKDGYLELIGMMTQTDPNNRPTMLQVLEHPWVTGEWVPPNIGVP